MKAADRARLVERARAELPEPGDPRLLMDDLATAGLAGPEALEVLSRTSLAWTQLRDLRLERTWQNGFGWFMARNLMWFGVLCLLLYMALGPPIVVLEAVLVGGGLFYLFVLGIAPLRLRRQKARRDGILANYTADLSEYLGTLED